MRTRTRAVLGSLLVVLALVGGWLVAAERRVPACTYDLPPVVTCELEEIRGVVGSEKVAFFRSDEVRRAFRRYGLLVEVEPAGSRTMACRADLLDYDFAFPGSPWAAEGIRQRAVETAEQESDGDRLRELRALAPVEVLESPIVVVTFDKVAEKLPGVVSQDLSTFDVERYLDMFAAGKRWGADLSIGPPFPTFGRAVLMSTRLDTSNSAELYLALASQVASGQPANGGAEFRVPGADDPIRTPMVDLFRAQGSTGLTSEEPFVQYLSPEGYQLPMQVAYEAQFLAAELAQFDYEPDPQREGDPEREQPSRLESLRVTVPGGGDVTIKRVMLYPRPLIVSMHTVVPLTRWGEKVARAMRDDARLRRLAAEHGFRPFGDPKTFAEVVEGRSSQAPVELEQPLRRPADAGRWNAFVDKVVTEVYGGDRAGVGCR